MRAFAKVILWALSVGAILVGIGLVAGGFVAQSSSDYAQRSLGQIAFWSWIGAVPAFVFALAANPLLSRSIPFLRGERGRWIAAMSAVVAGCGAAFMLLNIAAIAVQEIEYKLDPSSERLVLNYTQQVLSDDINPRGTTTIEAKYFGRDPADPLTAEPSGVGSTAPWELCLPFDEPAVPVAGSRVPTSRPLLDVLNGLEALEPYTRDQARLVFSEALRLCKPDDPAAQAQSLALLQAQLESESYASQSHVLMGLRLRDGVGLAADPAAALKQFQHAAAQNHPVAIYLLAHAGETGLGGLIATPEDVVAQYRAAKDAGVIMASRRLARAAVTNQLGLNEGEAFQLYAELCGLATEGQDLTPCTDYARSLLYGENGEPKSPSVARALSVAVCEAPTEDVYVTMTACADAGFMVHDGLGGAVDASLARGYFSKACDAGEINSCNSYGVLLLNGRGGPIDDVGAETAFRKGCEVNLGMSCFNLALMHDGGFGIPQNTSRAIELFAKSCELGYQDGCARAN